MSGKSSSVKPKGTAKTEIIIGLGAANLQRGLESLAKVAESLKTFDEEIETRTLQTAELEDKIQSLTEEYAEKRRSADINFQNDLKENQLNTIREILQTQGKIVISKEEADDNQTLKAEFQQKLEAQVNTRVQALIQQHKSEINLMQANYERDNAQQNAKVSNLEDKIGMLENQLKDYQRIIDENRKAEIERAKASTPFFPQNQQIPSTGR